MTDGQRRSRLTRRQLLGGVAGVAAGAAIPGPATGQTAATPTVMTQNVYVGVDLFELAGADSLGELLLLISEALGTLDPDRYAARARGIADAIAAAEPDVVALQEVGLVERVSDDEPDIDVLATLEAELDAADLSYEAVAETVTADIELPGVDDESGLRVANRDVLLVHADHETTNTVTDRYDATETVTVPGGDEELAIRRGYCLADVTVRGVEFTAVGTHLESSSQSTRREQAEELLEVVPAEGPAVLAGDFNSGPGTSTDAYDLLTDEFTDAYAAQHPDADGFTCCQAADLTNEQPQLEKRVDAVLGREITPTAASRVGHESDDRVSFESDSGAVELWPSDHAGVVATFEADGASTPTPTPTATTTPTQTPATPATPTATPRQSPQPTETTTEQATETADGDGPGFGVAGSLAALSGLGYALRRRLTRRK